MSYRIQFSRRSERRTADEKLTSQLEFIALRGLDAIISEYRREWHWSIGPIKAEMIDGRLWVFSSYIDYNYTGTTLLARLSYWQEQIRERAALAGQNAKFQSPWSTKLPQTPIESMVEPERDDSIEESEVIPLESLESLDPGDAYSHLFGLDAQIRTLMSSVQAAIDSGMENRFHSLMYGPPACGKTDVLQSTYKLLTGFGVSCLLIDAPATTEAGMRKLLLDEDEIAPQVIFIEEIEKVQHSFRLLLGLMDDRGTVTQLNFRNSATRQVKALVLASANDYLALQKSDSGALLSRFSTEIYCPRPTREILAQILERDIRKVNGSLDWIEPTLEYCFDKQGITDPRMLKRVALCGKEKLTTGEYQKDLDSIRGPGSGIYIPHKKSPVDIGLFD